MAAFAGIDVRGAPLIETAPCNLLRFDASHTARRSKLDRLAFSKFNQQIFRFVDCWVKGGCYRQYDPWLIFCSTCTLVFESTQLRWSEVAHDIPNMLVSSLLPNHSLLSYPLYACVNCESAGLLDFNLHKPVDLIPQQTLFSLPRQVCQRWKRIDFFWPGWNNIVSRHIGKIGNNLEKVYEKCSHALICGYALRWLCNISIAWI